MNRLKTVSRVILAIALLIIGTLHFIYPQELEKVLPEYLPYHFPLVYIGGILEILAGIGLLIPHLTYATAWFLVLLFIVIFPGNWHQAVNNIDVAGFPHDPPLIWLRFPMQALLVAWAWWLTRE